MKPTREMEIAKKGDDPRVRSIKGFHDRHRSYTVPQLVEAAQTLNRTGNRSMRAARGTPAWRTGARARKLRRAQSDRGGALAFAVLAFRLATKEARKRKKDDKPWTLAKLNFKEVAAGFDTVDGDKDVDAMGRAAALEWLVKRTGSQTVRRSA